MSNNENEQNGQQRVTTLTEREQDIMSCVESIIEERVAEGVQAVAEAVSKKLQSFATLEGVNGAFRESHENIVKFVRDVAADIATQTNAALQGNTQAAVQTAASLDQQARAEQLAQVDALRARLDAQEARNDVALLAEAVVLSGSPTAPPRAKRVVRDEAGDIVGIEDVA